MAQEEMIAMISTIAEDLRKEIVYGESLPGEGFHACNCTQ